jgi:hypothetical protein
MTDGLFERVLQSLPAIKYAPVEMPLRNLLSDHLGEKLTPELAASIEILAKKRATFEDRLTALQDACEELPQADCPTRHYFLPGVCVREMSIPANTLVVGAKHKQENLVIVSKGRLLIPTPDGVVEVAAGQTCKCIPGTKNAVVALEDSVWSNVFPNQGDKRDVNVVLQRAYGFDEADFVGGANNRQRQNTDRLIKNKMVEVLS